MYGPPKPGITINNFIYINNVFIYSLGDIHKVKNTHVKEKIYHITHNILFIRSMYIFKKIIIRKLLNKSLFDLIYYYMCSFIKMQFSDPIIGIYFL